MGNRNQIFFTFDCHNTASHTWPLSFSGRCESGWFTLLLSLEHTMKMHG